MGVGAGLYMYDVVVKKFTFAISSSDQFLLMQINVVYKSAVLKAIFAVSASRYNAFLVDKYTWLIINSTVHLLESRELLPIQVPKFVFNQVIASGSDVKRDQNPESETRYQNFCLRRRQEGRGRGQYNESEAEAKVTYLFIYFRSAHVTCDLIVLWKKKTNFGMLRALDSLTPFPYVCNVCIYM